MSADQFDRRDFIKRTGGLSAGAALANRAFAKSAAKMNPSRVLGANDRINIGLVGCGGRGTSDAHTFTEYGQANKNACQLVAVRGGYNERKALPVAAVPGQG